MKKYLILGMILMTSLVQAEQLHDIKILNIDEKEDRLILKLRPQNSPADSYFFLHVLKSDPKYAFKYSMITKKMDKKENCVLNLNIISFSAKPYGSMYMSEGVEFSSEEQVK